MPLASLVHWLSSTPTSSTLSTLALWGSLAALVVGLRAWSKGYVCKEERGLAGKTFLLTGGFSGVGLAVFQHLAAAGAQVIVLTPDPSSPSTIQLLLLLRSSTSNERLYAEECDLDSPASIKRFVEGWKKDAREGMVKDLEARIDGIVFCDEGGTMEWREKAGRVLTGRHMLVQLLMPVLLRSAATSTSPIRIVNTLDSPFYAAVTPDTFDPPSLVADQAVEKAEASAEASRQLSSIVQGGRVALASVLLWREFQARLSTSEPKPSTNPSASSDARVPSTSPILAFSVSPGVLRSSLRSLLPLSTRQSPHSRLPSSIYAFLSLLISLLAYPFTWIFGKRADEGAQVVLGAIMGDVERNSVGGRVVKGPDGQRVDAERLEGGDGRQRMRVRGGALYREGREVPLPLLDSLPTSVRGEFWDAEYKRLESLLAREGHKGANGTTGSATGDGRGKEKAA
ncbi:hypothetical protein NBRC10512_006432 [Rhodotorula toruloides]|uniref:RHTO0S01e01002g1_1 n=1 Tax=Rhodotorula toruloides TaxID=5286 RepID=A0A061ALC6_RHOTO|nr:RHTO0S01e01002g1_1 [Rhodotorula toruloides]